MSTIHFATTNPQKLEIARAICAQYDYTVESVKLEIDEIQGEAPEPIVRDKARRAYELYGRPVVVSDDSWGIHALGGFPGPYMKSMNHWFSTEDFLRLMHGVEDRRVTLYQYLAYCDGETTKVSYTELNGTIAEEPHGHDEKSPIVELVRLDSDNGKTIAEVFEQDAETFANRYTKRREAWHELMDWYTTVDKND